MLTYEHFVNAIIHPVNGMTDFRNLTISFFKFLQLVAGLRVKTSRYRHAGPKKDKV
jgi:hypothetical protein